MKKGAKDEMRGPRWSLASSEVCQLLVLRSLISIGQDTASFLSLWLLIL